MPSTGIDGAVAELRRVARQPHVRAVQLLRTPSGGPDLLPTDEPFWAAAEDLGIVIAAHHNFTGEHGMRSAPGFDEDRSAFMWLLSCDMETPTLPIFTILNLMLSGVLDRHPQLRFLFGETHCGWMPFWFEQMDDRYDRHHFWPNIFLPRRPSQYVKDQFRFAFLEDHIGVQLRHLIGVDTIMWSNDFPHAVGDWPYSEETVRRQFAGVPDDERLKITALNFLEWMHVITPQDKERLAGQALREPVLDDVLPRGARRL
jgi:predicted TIM-barrel fold metal-dependent hydrolase